MPLSDNTIDHKEPFSRPLASFRGQETQGGSREFHTGILFGQVYKYAGMLELQRFGGICGQTTGFNACFKGLTYESNRLHQRANLPAAQHQGRSDWCAVMRLDDSSRSAHATAARASAPAQAAAGWAAGSATFCSQEARHLVVIEEGPALERVEFGAGGVRRLQHRRWACGWRGRGGEWVRLAVSWAETSLAPRTHMSQIC